MKIDKDVPMPVGPTSKYPFPHMEVGDSFLIAESDADVMRIRQRIVGGAAYAYGRKHSKKFTTRCVDGGVRCWRIE